MALRELATRVEELCEELVESLQYDFGDLESAIDDDEEWGDDTGEKAERAAIRRRRRHGEKAWKALTAAYQRYCDAIDKER